MKKITLAILGLFFIGFMANAQLKFGLKGGLNLAKMTFDEDYLDDDIKMNMGYHFGAFALLELPMGLEFEAGAGISQKGFKWEMEIMGSNYSAIVKPLYLDIPLKLNYKMDIGPAAAFIGAGPIISYGFGGNITTQNPAGESTEDIKWGDSEDDDFKPLDLGLGLQAGVRFSKLQFSVSYDMGLSNISPEEDVINYSPFLDHGFTNISFTS